MNKDNEVKVDLIADPSKLKPGFDEAERKWKAYQDSLKQGAAGQAEVNRENQRFVQGLKDQAATLGMTRTQLQAFRADQMQLTAAQRESVMVSLQQIDAYERKQQSLRMLTTLATRAGAALVSAGAAAVTMSVRIAAEAERSEARMAAMWKATGMTAGFSRGELDDQVDSLAARTPFNDEKIRDAMTQLMSYRQVSGETFREVMTMATGLSELMGRDLTGAVHTLGRALEDPVNGLDSLRRAGVMFTPTQKEMIKDLVEHGRKAEAVAIILERLRKSGFADLAGEVNKEGGYTKAISGASKATGELFEALGKTSVIKAPVVGFLGEVTNKLTTMRNVVENGTWYQRLASLGYVMVPSALRPALGAVAAGARKTPSDPNSPEALAAREAAGAEAWQRDYEAQQRGLQKYIEAQEKKLAGRRNFGASWTEADLREALKAAAEELKEFERQDAGDDAFRSAFIQPYVQSAQESTDADADKIYTWQFGERVAMTRQEYAEFTKQMEAAKPVLQDNKDLYEDLIRATEGFGKASSKAAAEMLVDWKFSSDGIRGLLRQLAVDLNQMWIQRSIMNPLMNQAARGFPSLFGSGWDAGSGGAYAPQGMGTGMYTGTETGTWLHEGGVVGTHGRRGPISPMVFNGAPRMHRGGLLSDEVPIIGKRGEEMLTENDPRHRRNGGGVRVTVINNSSQPVDAEVGMPEFDPEGMVVSVILKDLDTGGPIRDRIERSRGGVR